MLVYKMAKLILALTQLSYASYLYNSSEQGYDL
jgi:hypothetical protein